MPPPTPDLTAQPKPADPERRHVFDFGIGVGGEMTCRVDSIGGRCQYDPERVAVHVPGAGWCALQGESGARWVEIPKGNRAGAVGMRRGL